MNISFFLIVIIVTCSDKMFGWKSLNRAVCIKNKFTCNTITTAMNNNLEDYLKTVEYGDTVRFIPPLVYGKVIKVYDGDTITIASKIPGSPLPLYRFSVRLRSIDSPEIKTESIVENRLALEARDALHELIFGKIILLKKLGTEKYGRVLADVYLNDLHVNQWMLDNQYAVPYDGGKKTRPIEWD